MIPTLDTRRLLLRPFTFADAAAVQAYAGDADVARTTLSIPHPYPDGAAEKWIASHQLAFLEGKHLTLAMCLREGPLVGAIGLSINAEHRRAEMGYWVAKPHWGRGYCTEAAQALLRYGFERLPLDRIFARHMAQNPASGRVMQKIGMRQEGLLRQDMLKDGVRVDVVMYGMLRDEFAAAAH